MPTLKTPFGRLDGRYMKSGRYISCGAIGDGTTDDTTAIQNAIDAAGAAGGGVVYLPKGNYRFTTGLIISNDDVALVGDGRSATYLEYEDPDGTGTAITITGGMYRISDLAINSYDGDSNLAIDLNGSWGQRGIMERVIISYKPGGPTGNRFVNGIWVRYGGTHAFKKVRVYCDSSTNLGSYGWRFGDYPNSVGLVLVEQCYAAGAEAGFWNDYSWSSMFTHPTVESCVQAFRDDEGSTWIEAKTEALTDPTADQIAAGITQKANFHFGVATAGVSSIIIGGAFDSNAAFYTGYANSYKKMVRLSGGYEGFKPPGVKAPAYQQQTFTNALKNAGFEYGLEAWTETGDVSSADETSVKKKGSHSRKVVTSAGETLDIYQDFHQRVGGTGYIGTDDSVLSMGAWVKSNNSSTCIRIERHAYPYYVCYECHSGSGDWEYLSCSAEAAGTLSYLRAELHVAESDTAYFDEIVVTVGLPIEPISYLLPDVVDASGRVSGKTLNGAVKSLTYAATISADMDEGNVFTLTTTGDCQINASNGAAGQRATFIITDDAIGGHVVTFGTNFKPSGTLVGTANQTATVDFAYDGTNWYEVSRTTGL